MKDIERLRIYHTVLAVMVLAAYVSEDWRALHVWLGYGIAAIIVFRLAWAATGIKTLGLSRFYPNFSDLRLGTLATHPAISRTLLLGIGLSLIGATTTGIMMDRSHPHSEAAQVRAVQGDDDGNGERKRLREHQSPASEELEELHELLSNLLMTLVIAHVVYLLALKRPLAKYMLFLNTPKAD